MPNTNIQIITQKNQDQQIEEELGSALSSINVSPLEPISKLNLGKKQPF